MRVSEFGAYGLHDRIMSQLPILGYKRPTPVQHRVIPLMIQHKNLIVEAPTGTGKTAAYGLPLISLLNLQKRSTQALILAPSRELVIQVTESLRSYFDGPQLRIGAVYGGEGIAESYDVIKSAPHILVAIPARLRDVMSQYQYDYLWRDIKHLIVDEGDKLMEAGFQQDFDSIRNQIRSTVQAGFFSATISPDAEALMRERFPSVMVVRVDPREALRNISFYTVETPEGKREQVLAALLARPNMPQALIFCPRRDSIHATTGFLRNVGLRAEAYYGNQDQTERENILRRFKDGGIHYLVASDLAARGLDIERLPAVINLSIPDKYDYYLHRVGRTGRAGRKGAVYNLLSGEREHIRIERHHQSLGLPLQALQVELDAEQSQTAPAAVRWGRFALSRGKQDKVRTTDVVGFLVNNAGIPADQIGTITLHDSYTLVDFPAGAGEALLRHPGPLTIKGKSVKVRKYLLEEQEARAQANRKLKQDRHPRKRPPGPASQT
ncbi:MAG: DEAD/DEAH box helicase [Bacteroidia bacterium]|nr:DEAD/DEAH box helicase [Bacteroidia bacterium]